MSQLASSMLAFDGGQIYIAGGRGPTGQTGPAGSAFKQYTSGMDIVVNRLIYVKDGLAYHADNATLGNSTHLVGLSVQSVSSGGGVDILTFGDRTDGSWSFNGDEQLWLGANGQLLTTAPSTGVLVNVGVVTSSTSINLNIQEPLVLG